MDGVDQGMSAITLRGLDHASTLLLINSKDKHLLARLHTTERVMSTQILFQNCFLQKWKFLKKEQLPYMVLML